MIALNASLRSLCPLCAPTKTNSLTKVTDAAGPHIRVVVELNDMTYGNHYEILMDSLRSFSSRSGGSGHPNSPDNPVRPFDYTLSPGSLARVDKRHGSCRDLGLFKKREAGSPLRRLSAAGSSDGGTKNTSATREGRGRIHWALSKCFASGAIVPSSLPETLLCQAFYNPAVIMIVEALLDPRAQSYAKVGCKGPWSGDDDDDDTDGPGSPVRGGEEEEGEDGASFLAQICPPKKFFTNAMHGGTRPNFEV